MIYDRSFLLPIILTARFRENKTASRLRKLTRFSWDRANKQRCRDSPPGYSLRRLSFSWIALRFSVTVLYPDQRNCQPRRLRLWEIVMVIGFIGNRISCRPMKLVVTYPRLSDFVNHSYAYKPNLTPLSPITIIIFLV